MILVLEISRFRRFLNWHWSLGARITLGIGLLILTASAVVFAGVYRLQEEQTLAHLDTQTKALLTQMVVLRQWVADYGGVWTTQPGDIWWSERDGYFQKTPAMVTKELSQRSDALGYYRFRITSLKLKNPQNVPTDFEREALHGFEVNPAPITNSEIIGGVKMYRYMIPLKTSAACLQCHAEQGYQVGDIRGGLSVLVPTQAYDEALAQNRLALILASAIIVAFVMGILYLIIAWLIVRPIRQLQSVAVAVGQGNYDVSCAIHTRDELETLGAAMNQMVRGLKRSHQELSEKIARRNRELAALSSLALTISQTAALEDVLHSALDETIAVMQMDGGVVHLWDAEGKALALAVTSSVTARLAEAWRTAPPPAPDHVLWVGDLLETHTTGQVLASNGYRAWASAPLKSKQRSLGVLHLVARAPREFTAEDASLLTCIANQIGVAVENARNAQRVEQMAIVEERSRLARELHDSLAQALGFLNLKTEMLEGMLAHGEWQRARAEIGDVRRVVRDACYDVRESIDGLRTHLGDDAALVPTAATYVHEFGQRTGLLTEFVVADGELRLAPLVEVEVFRIIQEALMNVRKHAQATRLRVEIKTMAGAVQIEITDNGRGFDPRTLPASQHFGLRIMRERAERLGGRLDIQSAPGQGTRIAAYIQGAKAGVIQ